MRPLTRDEMQQRLLEGIRMSLSYWLGLSDLTPYEQMHGMVFSILVMFDGEGQIPACRIMPLPHPTDKIFHKSLDENWWPDAIDIAGDLHEKWSQMK